MRLRLRHLWLLLPILIGASVYVWGQEKVRVLLLNSYHYGMDWTDGETAGVRQVFEGHGSLVDLQVEYMDTKRVSDDAHIENLKRLLEHKYRNTRFAGILATDNDAFEFLRRNRDRLFPGVPVVFTGVNFFRDQMLSGFSDCTGVAETFEGGQTVSLMRDLHPKARRIIVIHDATTTGKAVRLELEPMLLPHAGQVAFEFWDDLSLDQLRERLTGLTQDCLILLLPFARDGADVYVSYEDIAKLVSRHSPVPVYGTWDFYLGHGIVGGRLTNAPAQGRAAAEILLRVLAGEAAGRIPVTRVAPSEFQFDSRQLHRHGIPASALPAGSRVLFKTWFELYRTWVWLGGLLAGVMLLLFWGWVRNRLLRRRSEQALLESEQKLRGLFELSPLGIALVDMQGRFIEFKESFRRICGYPKEELEALDYWALTPGSYDEEEQRQLESLASHGRYGPYEKEYRRKDGILVSLRLNGMLVTDRRGRQFIWSIAEDITAQKAFEAELTATRESLALSLHGADLALTDWDIRSDRLQFGEGWHRLLGFDATELTARSATLAALIMPEDAPSARAKLVRHLKGETPLLEAEMRLRHKAGRWVWVQARGRVVERDGQDRAVRMAGTAMDISARKEAEAQIARLSSLNQLLLNSAGEGIYGVDLEGRCTFVNPAALGMLGYERDELMARSTHAAFHHHEADGSPYPEGDCPVTITLRDGIRRQTEDAFIRKDGEVFPVQMTVTPMKEEGRIVGVEVVFQDIARRKAMEAELLRLATTDPLTGMANRRRFLEQLEIELARVRRFSQPASLLMADLDHFKRINDTYGHAVGDSVLKHFSAACQQLLRRVDLAGRLGGEEFGILLPGTDGAGARLFAERFRAHIADTPAPTAKGAVVFTVSIGVAEIDPADPAPDNVVARADSALYRAKVGGRNSVELYVDLQSATGARPGLGDLVRLAWKGDYACGEPSIDREHRELFDLANVLLDRALVRDINPGPFNATFDALLSHVVAHFSHEEDILRARDYGRLVDHAAAHQQLVARALQLRRQADLSGVSIGELVDFLVSEVVAGHMLREDRLFFGLFKSR